MPKKIVTPEFGDDTQFRVMGPKFVVIPQDLIHEMGEVRDSGLAVYCVLSLHANNNTGVAYPSVRRIAKVLTKSTSTVMEALKRLRELGWIVRVGEKDGSYVYVLPFIRNKDRITGTNKDKEGVSEIATPKNKGVSAAERGVSRTERGVSNSATELDSRTRLKELHKPPSSSDAADDDWDGPPPPEAESETPEPAPDPGPVPEEGTPEEQEKIIDELSIQLRLGVIRKEWERVNGRLPIPFDDTCWKQLKLAIRRLKGWTKDELIQCVRNRFASEVNHTESPKLWLPMLESYAKGPLDRYGRPLNASGKNKAELRTERNRRALAEVRTGRRGR